MWILVCSWRNVGRKEGKGVTKRTRQVIIYCRTCHGNCRRLLESGQLTAGTTRPRFRSTRALVQPLINGSADVTLVVHLHLQQIFQSKRPLEQLWTAETVADNPFFNRKVNIRITALFFAQIMHICVLCGVSLPGQSKKQVGACSVHYLWYVHRHCGVEFALSQATS